MRVTVAKVLQTAVESGYLERNPAHGIQIGEREPKKQRVHLTLSQTQDLLATLSQPFRTIVLTALLTGMRIGEILALRWNRVDFLRQSIEISATYSDGQFGSPKTRSSKRVIPMSAALCKSLDPHRVDSLNKKPEDLVFCTAKGTPLSPKNLYNRSLAPTCDKLTLPRVSWQSFRHASATIEVDWRDTRSEVDELLHQGPLQVCGSTRTEIDVEY